MDITVNGQKTNTPDEQTVRDLVVALGLGHQAVAVEVNQHVIPHKLHRQTPLREGDRVEVVTLVGGG